MIEIKKLNNKLILIYSPQHGTEWIYEDYLNIDETFTLKKIFNFTKQNLYEDTTYKNDDFFINFLLGVVKEDYYYIPAQILKLKNDVLIYKDINVTSEYFGCSFAINILNLFEEISGNQIIIGGNSTNSIPADVFNNLLKSFPTQTEKKYYVRKRISNILREYIDTTKNYGKLYDQYLEKRAKKTPISNTIESIKNYEKEKYSFILNQLHMMLDIADGYSEKDWQNKIIEIVTLVYPKYLIPISELKIKDKILNKNRRIDITLLDENGNIDIVEIKTPEKIILSQGQYRDNYIPSRELSGSIMQLEKYLYHLNRMGFKEEENLSEKYNNILNIYNLKIKITNPKGVIIAGRSNNWNEEQKLDFEIIKRKYAHVIDIITYDDLIKRLENLVTKFSN